MPRSLVHALIWSHEHQHYQLYSHGQPEQGLLPADGRAFARWLDAHTAFAFVGQTGRLSVLKEARRGGSGYWYAYLSFYPWFCSSCKTMLPFFRCKTMLPLQFYRKFIFNRIWDPAVRCSVLDGVTFKRGL